MGNVLAYCETNGSQLRSNALANIQFARQAAEAYGGAVIALLVGNNAKMAAEDASRYASKVLVVEDAALEHYLAETYAPIVARIADEQNAVVISAIASAVGKDLMPRVAAIRTAAMASDISAMVGKHQFERPIYAGNANATVEVCTDTMCVTVRQSSFDAASPHAVTGEISTAAAGAIDSLGAEFMRVDGTSSDRPDLNDADVVVSGGRGMKSGENFKVLEELADLLGAAMGASRAATDAGMVPADWQVGQTGKIVAPNLYFAVAISGAIQHLAGMKGSKTIVAINKDPEAPIFQVADYGLVDTWENAIPALIGEIKKLQE